MIRKTASGKALDMDRLVAENELVPAISNLKMNARGDIIDSEGNIVERREEVVQRHYEQQIQRNGSEPEQDD